MLFSNVTKYGPQARAFVNDTNFTLYGMVETHATEAEALKHKGQLSHDGYRSTWSPATSTIGMGSKGGAMAAAKKRIDLQELDLSQDDPAKPAHLPDMVVTLLRLRGITVDYFWLSDGWCRHCGC